MGFIYRVSRAAEADPVGDVLEAGYGWAHVHAFHRLLAAEEAIDLAGMVRFGGARSWAKAQTPLRPLFDVECFRGGGVLAVQDCAGLQPRLREISARWSQGLFVGEADDEMKRDQALTLQDLVAVVDRCVETGRPLSLGS